MTNKRLNSTFFSYIFCVATCSFVQNINSFFLKKLFIQSEISYTELDSIDLYQIFGYIIAPTLLILASKVFSPIKIIIFSITVYTLNSLIISHILSSSHIINFCMMVMSGSNLVIIILLLSRLAINSHKNDINTGYLVFSSWLSGYLLGGMVIIFFGEFIQDNFIFLIITTTLLSIIIFNVLVSRQFASRRVETEPRFNIIVKNMRLEAMTSFVIFYVIMVVLDGYEYYALTENLLVFTANTTDDCYAFTVMLIIIYWMRNIYKWYNPYIINILCLGIILAVSVTMPVWGGNYLASMVLWLIIGILIYTLFASNILILTEKFENMDLHFAISIFALMGSVGFYAGYITSQKSEDNPDENGFLYSICFVLVSLIVYYLLRFKKDRLSRWSRN